MSKKLLAGIAVAVTFFGSAHAAAYVQTGVPVGTIKVNGTWGFSAFKRADGGVFPGCAYDTTTMWIDSYGGYEGMRAMLATLLSARAMSSKITVYYNAPDGYCRIELIELEAP